MVTIATGHCDDPTVVCTAPQRDGEPMLTRLAGGAEQLAARS
jgi:hypothetical protein